MTIVRAGFFSLTSAVEGGTEEEYLRWHLLDHLPEQHSLPGVRLGTRWRADDACVAARILVTPDFEPVRHAVCYLMTDPVEQTLHEFGALAGRLRGEGRMPMRAVQHLLGALSLEHAASALVSADALPFRPHTGVVLIVESGEGDLAAAAAPLMEVAGVAGVLSFRATDALGRGADQGQRFGLPPWNPADRSATIAYVDADLVETTERLRPALEARWSSGTLTPDLAAPFRSFAVPAVGLEPTLSTT
jgi:hypothetical protein